MFICFPLLLLVILRVGTAVKFSVKFNYAETQYSREVVYGKLLNSCPQCTLYINGDVTGVYCPTDDIMVECEILVKTNDESHCDPTRRQ